MAGAGESGGVLGVVSFVSAFGSHLSDRPHIINREDRLLLGRGCRIFSIKESVFIVGDAAQSHSSGAGQSESQPYTSFPKHRDFKLQARESLLSSLN